MRSGFWFFIIILLFGSSVPSWSSFAWSTSIDLTVPNQVTFTLWSNAADRATGQQWAIKRYCNGAFFDQVIFTPTDDIMTISQSHALVYPGVTNTFQYGIWTTNPYWYSYSACTFDKSAIGDISNIQFPGPGWYAANPNVPLAAPTNLQVSPAGTQFQLSWDTVANCSEYEWVVQPTDTGATPTSPAAPTASPPVTITETTGSWVIYVRATRNAAYDFTPSSWAKLAWSPAGVGGGTFDDSRLGKLLANITVQLSLMIGFAFFSLVAQYWIALKRFKS